MDKRNEYAGEGAAFMKRMTPQGMGKWIGQMNVNGGAIFVESKREVLKAVFAGNSTINLLPYLKDAMINRICKAFRLNYTWPKGA